MNQLRCALILPLLVLFMCRAEGSSLGGKLSAAQIDRMIEIARAGEPRAGAAAAQLASLARIDGAQFDDAAIERVADLLDAPDDAVRFWAARTLGNLGARGRVFAARLLALLPWADCLRGNATSAAGFRFALKQMGMTPEPAMPCEEN